MPKIGYLLITKLSIGIKKRNFLMVSELGSSKAKRLHLGKAFLMLNTLLCLEDGSTGKVLQRARATPVRCPPVHPLSRVFSS